MIEECCTGFQEDFFDTFWHEFGHGYVYEAQPESLETNPKGILSDAGGAFEGVYMKMALRCWSEFSAQSVSNAIMRACDKKQYLEYPEEVYQMAANARIGNGGMPDFDNLGRLYALVMSGTSMPESHRDRIKKYAVIDPENWRAKLPTMMDQMITEKMLNPVVSRSWLSELGTAIVQMLGDILTDEAALLNAIGI